MFCWFSLSYTDAQLWEWDVENVDVINCFTGVMYWGVSSEMQEILHMGEMMLKTLRILLEKLFISCFHEKTLNASVNHTFCTVKGKKGVTAKYKTILSLGMFEES